MSRSVLAQLRDLSPIRPLTRIEALSVAERQAMLLLKLSDIQDPPVPEGVISELPRFEVYRTDKLIHSGGSEWLTDRKVWTVALKGTDAVTRQRFSLAHEFKHIIDRPFARQLYGAVAQYERLDWQETVCNYFAGCLLMPRPWLKRAWTSAPQRLSRLATNFEVSQAAMRTRLSQLGLLPVTARCDPPDYPARQRGAHSAPTSRHTA